MIKTIETKLNCNNAITTTKSMTSDGADFRGIHSFSLPVDDVFV